MSSEGDSGGSMQIDQIKSLTHHLFDLKLSIESFNINDEEAIDLKDLIYTWSQVPKSLWKKRMAFKEFIERNKISGENVANCVFEIVSEHSSGRICRLSSSSSAFLLLCLESGDIEASTDNLVSCLLKLVPCIEFSLAQQIELENLKKKYEIPIKFNDYANLQLLHFFPSVKVDWNGFSKFLNDLKGFPQQFQDVLPFLGNFFNFNLKNFELFSLVERLARRNSAVSSAIFYQIGQCENFNENIEIFSTIFEILVPLDNEIVQNFIEKLSKIILISNSLTSNLLKSFTSTSAKGKENISKFIAGALKEESVDPRDTVDPSKGFVDLASKEISNESTLSALIQCASVASSSKCSDSLGNFLKTNLKNSQKISIKSSILFGIAKSKNFNCLNDEILLEIFSTSFLKEITLNPQAQTYFICALAALVNNCNAVPVDAKLLKDCLLALSKPAGPAIFCEKAWSSLDKELSNILLLHVILPVIFTTKPSQPLSQVLLPFSMSALAWFTLNGSKESFKLIRSHAKLLSLENVDLLSGSLEKFLDGSDFKPHRCWNILQLTCSSVDALKSPSLALLCHDKNKLLGLGAGSWAELVRSACPKDMIDQFCLERVESFIPPELLSKTCHFYLLETLISLSPSLVNDLLCPLENLNKSIDELLEFTPAQWSHNNTLLTPSKPAATKSVTSKSPTSFDPAPLLSSISKFKNIVSIIRAIALALPFHHIFTDVRSSILIKLLQLLECIDSIELSQFIVESLYEISTESLNGQGPLLISLFLNSTKKSDLIDPSWFISDQVSLIDSVHKIITLNSDVSEFSFISLVLSKSLPLSKPLFDTQDFKNLLEKLFSLSEQSEAVDSRVIFDFIHGLLEVSRNFPISVQSSIVLLLIEIAEIPKLEIPSDKENLLKLNFSLRSTSPSTQLMILKFLTAFSASHSCAHLLMECSELIETIWLLHFKVMSESESGSEKQDKEDDLLDFEGTEDITTATGTATYEIQEVTAIAAELCNLLGLKEISNFDALNHICQLETETGEEKIQIKNLLEHYIAALSSSISSDQILDKISFQFSRLLSARTTPNGIVRLTKNVDRSKLDFTKQTRKAILRSISQAARKQENLIQNFVNFCFKVGFNDPDEINCEIIFSTLISIVENCQNSDSEGLYEQLQNCLNLVPADNDRVKVYSVILLGRASSRLPSLTSSSTRVWELIDRIKESLNIPSERVQKAVADTLVPLLRSQKDDNQRISTLTCQFSSRLRDAKEDYGALRGAAFGLAALIEACGTVLIRTHEIFDCFTAGLALLNKKGSEASVCSVLAAIEIISARCGIAFEPYIAPLVPGVLEALGDSRQRVREDAEACADAMMAALSPLSVALILPPLLDMAGMDGCDPRYSWRAKLGAVTWLGSMACLAPKVLTPALPKIIPALIVALTDAHEKVHLAAHHALAVKYAAIIRSPEIKAALPAILRALSDPPKFASACLGDIIGTSFCHAVDGPSLALLEPLLSRALRERGTGAMSEAKRRAILIIANLGSLMDPSELRPYLINLVPALRGVLGDAVPQVRSGSARALGIMMRLMHNNNLAQDCPVLMQIVPECLETIFSTLPSITSIDRAGAAQAIAQVTAARGLDQLIELVNEQVAPVLFNEKATKSTGTSREALLHLCAALPAALSPTQIPKLYEMVFTRERLFSILQSTASEDEGVREISTKTIRSLLLRQALFVDLQGALEILLKGSSDGRWRLRLTSFTILADLLPVLSMSTEGSTCDTQNRSLSGEMRARVLSRLFFGRFDSNGLIRNAAFSLWKSIVTHPPRVILEILPILVDDCVASLEIVDEFEADDEEEEEEYEEYSDSDGSESDEGGMVESANVKVDRSEMASSALQDILVKLSDRVLLPFLKRLSQIFASNQSNAAGVLLAARIVTSVIIVPNLIPPHQRSANSTPVVSVPRAQIDEALKIVLNLTQQGLTSSERTVDVAVGLFGKIAQGLATSPALLDRIISELFLDVPESADALISVLNRRPQILMLSLVNRFKKLTNGSEIDWDWWKEVLAAPGPFLAPHAPSLIVHAIKLLNEADDIDEHLELFDALLASMATYDPDLLYGDEADGDDGEEDLEDLVETGLFSFGQFLETLWSARNLPILASKLIERYAQQGSFRIEKFFDIWLDRLLVTILQQPSDIGTASAASAAAAALEGIIERGIEVDEALTIISHLNQTIETRSIVIKNISTKLPVELLVLLIKSLCLPIISDSTVASSDRFEASKLLSSILLPTDSDSCNLRNLPNQAATTLLGALIRCLSDRTETVKVERLKSGLLPILFTLIKNLNQVGKPFHPQLARLGVNVLKDLIAAVSFSGNSIDFDQSHPRGQIALVTCQLIGLLLIQMTRSDVLLEELTQFRVDEDGTFDDLSTKNARVVLLAILSSSNSFNSNFSQNVANFIIETVKIFMVLPNKEIDIIRETAQLGLVLSDKLPQGGPELKTYINNLI